MKEVSDDSTAGTASAVSLLAPGAMTLGRFSGVASLFGIHPEHDFRDSTTLSD